MSNSKQETIASLKRLIDHHATSAEERLAARYALDRILKAQGELNSSVKTAKKDFASIFKKSMARTFQNESE